MTREEAKKHFWCDTNEFGESVAKRSGSINYSKIFTGYYIGSEIDKFIDKIYNDFENKKCENCKQWVGNAPFKGFCNVTGSSCCLGGCNDYFETKG